MQVDFHLIDDAFKLNSAIEAFTQHKPEIIAIDTEFIPENSYIPQLCLLQVCAFDKIFIFDPISIDISGLEPFFADAKILFHAGTHDLVLLEKLFNMQITNIFDTQIASALATTMGKRSYADLCRFYLNKEISKGETLSNWANRPLSNKQLEYAARDVLYLFPLLEKINQQLEQFGRCSWAEEEFDKVKIQAKNFTANDDSFQKLYKVKHLKGSEINVAREIYYWRERKALANNQPPKYILNDMMIYIIAKAKPQNLDELAKIRKLSKKIYENDGMNIVECVHKGLNAEIVDLPMPDEDYSLNSYEKINLEFLELIIKIISHQNQISDALITENHLLKKLVKAKSRKKQEEIIEGLSGWRCELLKSHLIAFIEHRIILKRTSKGYPVTFEII